MTEQEIIAGLDDPWWRLNNLYWIVDENGRPLPFVPNDEQKLFYDSLWTRNIILKARQLGFSTLLQLLALDQAMFNANYTAGVIADTLENAMKLFKKVSFAYDRLPEPVKAMKPFKRQSMTEIEFANGSTISVGTSFRGNTAQFLHVSEMGKIAAKYPDKAREIVTGAFPAVHKEGILTVESTAEGNGGEFFDLCDLAMKLRAAGKPLTALDFRFHFFPWFKKASYRLDPAHVTVRADQDLYFRKLMATLGVQFDDAQRAWYVKTGEILKRDMKREHPSTPKEAFEVAIEGAIYGDEMTALREQSRITKVPLDLGEPVNTFWDFGLNDATAIWFHQRVGQANHWVHYVEGTGKGLAYWKQYLADWAAQHGVRWGKHHLPHDADTEMQGEHPTTKHKLLTSGSNPLKDTKCGDRIADLTVGIDLTRAALLNGNYFDEQECAQGIRCLDSYQYLWDDKRGQWSNEPYHNWASHGADAWREYAQSYRPPGALGGSIAKFKNRKRVPV